MNEKGNSAFEAQLINGGIISVLKYVIKAVSKDGLGPYFLYVLRFMGVDAGWIVIEVGLNSHAYCVFGVFFLVFCLFH
jgi:6-phosphofructokinase